MLLALPPQAQAQAQAPTPVVNKVPDDWSLKPSGLAVGDQFRLLFVSTMTRDGSSADIGDYNTHVQTPAAAGHADIQDYSSGFRALACTAATDAQDNTGTTGVGVPIYWLQGDRVSQDYNGFYDGRWDSHSPRDEDGESSFNGFESEAFTGCMNDGTSEPDDPLGADMMMSGWPYAPTRELAFQLRDNSLTLKVYGLSEIFVVAAVSTEATLSGLALEDASGNSVIALTPSTFAATKTPTPRRLRTMWTRSSSSRR